jgi:hypothetical protein
MAADLTMADTVAALGGALAACLVARQGKRGERGCHLRPL